MNIDNRFKQALDKEIGEMRLNPRIVGRAVALGRAKKFRRKLAAMAGICAAFAAAVLLFLQLYSQIPKNVIVPLQSPSAQPNVTATATCAPTASPAPTTRTDAGALIRFYSGGKVGFKDAGGNIAIPADFACATDFNADGVAVVAETMGGKLALLGPEGLRTGYGFDEVGVFSSGLAAVKAGDKYGYIDATGRMAVEPRFAEARAFSHGLAAVAVKIRDDRWERWGFIDVSGKFVVEPLDDGIEYRHVSDFAGDGTAIVSILTEPTEDSPSGELLYGAVDKQGNLVLPVEYYSLSEAWQGIRVASQDLQADSESGYHKQGLIDEEGNWLVQPQYFEMGSIQNGLVTASVVKKGQQYTGILRMDGTWLYEPTHQSVFAHKYGLVIFADRKSSDDRGTMVLYDESGNNLLNGQSYNQIQIISPDYIRCVNLNKDGTPSFEELFGTDGNPPVPGVKIVSGYEICDGFAAADMLMSGDGYGLKDKDGSWRNSCGILGETGWVVEPKYNQILYFDGKRGRGVRIVPEKSSDKQIAFVFELLDETGTVTDSSDIEYASADDFSSRMYTERNYFSSGQAIHRLEPN